MDQAKAGPDKVETWLRRLSSASSDEERLFYVSRIQALAPHSRTAARWMYDLLKRTLSREPFLAYLDENADQYRVRTAQDLILVVPKNRATPESYRPGRFGAFGRAYHDVMLAILGLALSGPLAIVFGFLSVVGALRAIPASKGRERVRAAVIVLLALLIFIPAVLLSYLLWLHIVS